MSKRQEIHQQRKKYKHTQVFNLNLRDLRKPSKVSHHAVIFGGALTNSSFAKSRRLRSTAKDGSSGAQGNSPRERSWIATGEQVQTTIFSIPIDIMSVL